MIGQKIVKIETIASTSAVVDSLQGNRPSSGIGWPCSAITLHEPQ
jgi:hypothetical protein